VIEIASTARSYPKLPYEKIKKEVLGSNYKLSLVFLGEKKAKELNQTSRKKDYIPNVLSFPLDNHQGEIYITPLVAKREAKKYNHTYQTHVTYLFIHGLLHLKGYDHGVAMDKLEQKYLKKFS